MKIAFIGTHGIGKTTLAHELCAALKKRHITTELLQEVAGTCPLPINEKTGKSSQEWILTTQLQKEIELEYRLSKSSKPGVLVCDRSIFDAYVYSYNAMGHDEVWKNLVLSRMPTYDLLFKVSINPDYGLTADGVRSVDSIFQQSIDKKMDDLLEQFKIPVKKHISIESTLETVLAMYRGISAK
ncbi:MAG: AAA family ATPase [Candidatus Woesearchaeota archaeon]